MSVASMDGLGIVHTGSAAVALLLGPVVFFRDKGDSLHRRIGYGHVVGMAALNGTALAIYDLFGGWGPFHWLALVSLATLAAGFVPALIRRPAKWLEWHYFGMCWSYVGLAADRMTKHLRAARRGRWPRLLPPDPLLGWTRYVWLAFLAVFLVEPVVRLHRGTLTAGYAAVTLLGIVVFLVTYFRGYWVAGGGLVGIVAAQALLGVAFAPINTGASVFFIYATAFAGYLPRFRTATAAIVALAAVGLLSARLTAAPLPFYVPAVLMPILIGFVNMHQAQLQRSDARLRLAHEQIEHLAAVAERERIARDLHDVLGHTLSLIVLKSEVASKLATRDGARATTEIRDIERVARTALREVREAIRGYRTSLAEEVERARSLLDAAGIRAEIGIASPRTGPRTEETLALALREAVTNVVRHSGATAFACGVRRTSACCGSKTTAGGAMRWREAGCGGCASGPKRSAAASAGARERGSAASQWRCGCLRSPPGPARRPRRCAPRRMGRRGAV